MREKSNNNYNKIDTFANIFKFALYRIIFNVPLGIFGIEIIFQSHNEIILKITDKVIQILEKFPFCNCPEGAFVHIIKVIFVGEIFALLGETFLNAIFEYDPVVNKKILEKVSPIDYKCKNNTDCNKQNQGDSNYITYSEFFQFIGENAAREVSEIHFVLSRILSGFSIIFLILSFIISFPISFINLVFYSIIIIRIKCRCKNKKNFNILFLFFVLSTIGALIAYLYLKSKETIAVFFIYLSIFLFLCSINYRAHANRLIKTKSF